MKVMLMLYEWVTPAAITVAAGANRYGPLAAEDPPAGAPAPDVVQVMPVIIVFDGNTGVSTSVPYAPGALPLLVTVTV